MKVARNEDDLVHALQTAKTEAKAAFGDDAVYIEKYLEKPRHIEIQVLGDGKGNAIHLGERDCSLQRRHQKVWEEGPSPALNLEMRERIGGVVAKAMQDLQYAGAGTIEFLYEDGEFYFIEMNTRIQVEHPVTEMITGIDLVNEQIRVAAGAPLSVKQSDVKIEGHAIECRVNAEHPSTFRPSPGTDQLLPPARRPRRARRFGGLSGLPHPAALRLARGQAHRPWPHPQRVPHAPAPGPGRVRGRRHRHHAPALPHPGAQPGHPERPVRHPLARELPEDRRVSARIRRRSLVIKYQALYCRANAREGLAIEGEAMERPCLAFFMSAAVPKRKNRTVKAFAASEWEEVSLDIDESVKPDIVDKLPDLSRVKSGSFDAVYSAHNIEHLYPHEVPVALKAMRRVLRSDGFVILTCPDLQMVGERLAAGDIEKPLYTSSSGPVSPLDMLYGFRPAMKDGNLYMAHHTGFTLKSLGDACVNGRLCQVLRVPPPAPARPVGDRDETRDDG